MHGLAVVSQVSYRHILPPIHDPLRSGSEMWWKERLDLTQASTDLGVVRDGLASADCPVGGRFSWSAGLVRDHPPDSMSPSGTARGMGSSAGYSAYFQGTPGNGFPTAAPQGIRGYQYPTAGYGQQGSQQTQNFGGIYKQTNAAATSSPQAQTTSASPPQAYPASMPAIGGLTPAPEVRREEEYPAAAGLDEVYTSYQSALMEIFQNVRASALATAGDSLLAASHWLLSSVVELGMCLPTEWDMANPTLFLGLTSDDSSLYDERIKLWKDFNHAWLALFQR